MKFFLEEIRTKKLTYQRNIFFILTLGLLLNSLLLSFLLLNKDERIVVIPSSISQPIWLEGKKVSASYLEENAVFLINLLLNQSPSNAAYNRELLLRHVASAEYGDLKEKLLEDEKVRITNELSTNFIIREVKIDSKQYKVVIKGLLQSFVVTQKLAEEEKSFELSFCYKLGKLLLTNFRELEELPK